MPGANPPGVLLPMYRVYGIPAYSAARRIAPSTGSFPSAEMIRSFASSVADVAGSSSELDGPGALSGTTCGCEGIVGIAGRPKGRPNGGSGNGSGTGNGGGGGSGGSGRADAS